LKGGTRIKETLLSGDALRKGVAEKKGKSENKKGESDLLRGIGRN